MLFTKTEFADHCGLTTGAISNAIRRGNVRPTENGMINLADKRNADYVASRPKQRKTGKNVKARNQEERAKKAAAQPTIRYKAGFDPDLLPWAPAYDWIDEKYDFYPRTFSLQCFRAHHDFFKRRLLAQIPVLDLDSASAEILQVLFAEVIADTDFEADMAMSALGWADGIDPSCPGPGPDVVHYEDTTALFSDYLAGLDSFKDTFPQTMAATLPEIDDEDRAMFALSALRRELAKISTPTLGGDR